MQHYRVCLKCLICNEIMIPCLVFVNFDKFTLGDFFSKIIARLQKQSEETPPSFTLMQQNLILFEQGKINK